MVGIEITVFQKGLMHYSTDVRQPKTVYVLSVKTWISLGYSDILKILKAIL